LELWQAQGNLRGQATALLNMGYNHSDLNQIDSALECYQVSLRLFQTLGDRRGQASAQAALMQLHFKTGSFDEVIRLAGAARNLLVDLDDKETLARLANTVGLVYYQMGGYEAALSHHVEALGLFQETQNLRNVGPTLLSIGKAHFAAGRYDDALECFRRSIALDEQKSDRRFQSIVARHIGLVHQAQGDGTEALRMFREALDGIRAVGDLRMEAHTLRAIAELLSHDEKETALGYFDAALQLYRLVQDAFDESGTLAQIAAIHRRSGRLESARMRVVEALGIAESLRQNIPSDELRTSYSSLIYEQYGLYIDVLMCMHAAQPDKHLDIIALNAGERGRSRALIAMLHESKVNIRTGGDARLLEQEQRLQQILTLRVRDQMQLLSRKHDQAAADALAREVSTAAGELDEVRAQIRLTSPRYAALTQPQPLDLDGIRDRVLDGQTLLLEYVLGEERSYLWTVTKAGMTSHVLPPRLEIEALVRRVRESLAVRQKPRAGESARQFRTRAEGADEDYWKTAAELSRLIIGPAADQLREHRLLIVPDGLLQYLPFAALPIPDGRASENQEGPVPLVARHEIVLLPSASTLSVLQQETEKRQPAEMSVAVFADPVFDIDDPRISGPDPGKAAARGAAPQAEAGLGRLISTLAECEAILSVAPGDRSMKAVGLEANRHRALSADLAQYRILHFATHGIINDEHPNLCAIVLSTYDARGSEQNGFLGLHDIYNLHLPVELVVLSACETALGKNVRGEGLIGLVRGFMYAGAARVVATLWNVQDESTAELMKRFYGKMFRENLSPAAALRAAQVEMWKQRRYTAPFYWAGFVLQGQYR
ncbi:MAG: CHAT domain-containing protein, partial [Acidobacteriota bacterium]